MKELSTSYRTQKIMAGEKRVHRKERERERENVGGCDREGGWRRRKRGELFVQRVFVGRERSGED